MNSESASGEKGIKAFVLDPTYRIEGGRANVYLYGTLENGKSFCSVHQFRPYFFIRESDKALAEKLRKDQLLEFDLEESEMSNFSQEGVVKVLKNIPGDVPGLRQKFEDAGIVCYEADIRYAYRFMMDKGVLGSCIIKGKPEGENPVVFHDPDIEPCYWVPNLKVLSFDIETDMKASVIYSIALNAPGHDSVLLHDPENREITNGETFETETDMLNRFLELVQEIDPDIITGWNVVDFDLKVVIDRCKANGIEPVLGRSQEPSSLRIQSGFLRDSQAKIVGRVVLDGIRLLRMSFIRLDNYKLSTAAKTILGDDKLITGDHRVDEIDRLYKEDPQQLAEYNLKDTQLVTRILEKTDSISLAIRRSLLTGMPPDRVDAAIASLDSLYLRKLKERKLVAISSRFVQKERGITGGYVKKSDPGLYDFVIVCDFKSLYPSAMRTFNIDPVSYIPSPTDEQRNDPKNFITAPNGAVYSQEEGILPQLISELMDKRAKAKKNNDPNESQAIKLLMNSFFGSLASPNSRFFNLEMADSITHFGQHLIKKLIDMLAEEDLKVIYGDTDSIFVLTKSTSVQEAQKLGNTLSDQANKQLADYIKETWNRDSMLELEFEKIYAKFLMPTVRGSQEGSKKRYAGLLAIDGDKSKIDVVGLEVVRRDWTQLAKDFQMTLLDKVFAGQPVESYIQSLVKDLRAGKFDEKLVYRKALTKPLHEYVKTTPPHVKAARKLPSLESNIVEYVMTPDGPEPVELEPTSLDYEHYIEKQLRPIAETILSFLNKSFDDILKGTSQSSLFEF